MKKLTGLVIVVIAIILGGYYAMGVATERTLKKNIEMVSQSNGLYVDIEQYNRGWFKSSAVLNWRLHIPPRIEKNEAGQQVTISAKDYTIQMPLAISHGPVIFADANVWFGLGYAHTDLVLPPTYAQQFDAMYTSNSVKPHLDVSIFVNYLNNCRLHVMAPQFKLVAKDGHSQFEWLGLNSDISISSQMSHVDGSVTLDGLSMMKGDMKAILGKTVSDYDLKQTETGLYLGDANLSVPSLLVTQNDQKVFALEQLDVHSSSQVTNGLFTSNFKSELDKMYTADSKVYGPGTIDVSIRNLDAQILAKINDEVNTIQQGNDTQRQQALLALLPEIPKLLSKGAQFEISKLSMVMPEGNINGDLLISLPNEETGNPFQLIQKIQGQGQLKITAAVLKSLAKDAAKQKLLTQPAQPSIAPATTVSSTTATADTAAPVVPAAAPTDAAEVVVTEQPVQPQDIDQQASAQADEKLAALVKAGLLNVQGTDYVIQIKLANGQLSINDQPFNPAMMQF